MDTPRLLDADALDIWWELFRTPPQPSHGTAPRVPSPTRAADEFLEFLAAAQALSTAEAYRTFIADWLAEANPHSVAHLRKHIAAGQVLCDVLGDADQP